MSGIAPLALFHVTRLRVHFRDDLGNAKTIQGTGFWLKHGALMSLVTNAHNLDPTMKLGNDTPFKLERVEIALRMTISGAWQTTTKFFEVQAPDVKLHPTADVALVRNPTLPIGLEPYRASHFNMDDLASNLYLTNSLAPMDIASFMGFPGEKGIPWYDEQWQMAVARVVNIASLPGHAFSNKAIATSDTMLVSGLSFSGSSGSPVIAHEKGIRVAPGGGLTAHYDPPKLIGIMSGHWKDDAYRHSGLSYLTRTTSIFTLL